ncbi:MAG: helix-turn-helix domain-containing protein [Micromonosporaceae bacterium]
MVDANKPRGALLEVISAALRRERTRAGLSLSQLAKQANLAKSTLSQLEAGVGNPSVETLWALANALGVPFSQLVDPPTPPVRVVRAGRGHTVASEHASFTGALLASCPPGVRSDIYVITLEPGPAREAAAHIPGSVEHLIMISGRLRAGPLDDLVEIGPGDYLSFPADVPHRYEALEPGVRAAMVMEHA